MKCIRVLSFVPVLIAVSTPAWTQSDAQKSFAQLKALAGTWQGAVTTDPPDQHTEGAVAQVSLRVTSRGNFSTCVQRFDVLFDIGAHRSFADCRRVVNTDGRLVLVGASGGAVRALGRLLRGQLMSRLGRPRIVTFLTRIRQDDLIALKELVEAGKLLPVIDRHYPLSGVPDAIRYLGTRQVRGKAVIKVA